MKAAIVVDDWKLLVFRRRLERAGFVYEDAGPFTGDTTVLHVAVEPKDLRKLKSVITESELECERSKP